MSNMLEPVPSGESLAALLKQPVYAKRFEAVLGERAPQFASSLISIGNTMKDVDPKSIIGSAMTAAALDLPIDKNLGFAWIVPYRKGDRKLAQFQMGYRGYVQLAQRSSQYSRMNATPINKEVFLGYDEVGEPNLDWDQYDPAKPVWGYFFGFQLTNGFTKKAVWSKEKILAHARRYSQSFRSGAEIWTEQFDGMATKTVISNTLRKWGPLSVQLQRALQADQAIIKDVDAEPIYPEIEDAAESEKPVFEHPAKAEQEQEQKAEKPKTEPKKKAVEPKPEPAPEPPPQPVAQPELVQPQPEETKPVPPPAPAEPGKKQVELAAAVKEMGFTWEDWVGWASTALPGIKASPPKSWADVTDVVASLCVKNPKGVAAGIRGWKAKAG